MIPVGTNLQLRNIPSVTLSLIAINCYFFIATFYYPDLFFPLDFITDSEDFAYYFVSFFSVFFHADIYHLVWNMIFLWIFGSYLEDKIGSKRFLFYYFVCEIGACIFHLVFDGDPGIGASGAISGIMGIYLFRCHYSKIKTIIPVFPWFFKADINAKWLMLFWILRDVYDSFYTVDNIGHWAHIGGYVTGMIIGKINNYWKEAKVEHLYERATYTTGIRESLVNAEEDLLEVLRINPDNGDAHLQLARHYADHSTKRDKGKKHYLAAAHSFFLKNTPKSMSGEIFMEYLGRYREPQEPVLHFKYAHTLSDVGNYDGASRILEPVINKNNLKGVIGEKIFVDYIRFSLKADLMNKAQYAVKILRESNPESLKVKKAESLIHAYKPKARKKVHIERATGSGPWGRIRDEIDEITSEPLYWFLALTGVIIFSVILYAKGLLHNFILVLPFVVVLAFIMVLVIRRIESFLGIIYGGGYKSEEEGLREYNINSFLDKARVSEREERYDDAIDYLNAVLQEDRNREHHLAVWFQIARLYHKKLNQPQKAIDAYKILFKTAPKDHPFRREAFGCIKELSQLCAAKAYG